MIAGAESYPPVIEKAARAFLAGGREAGAEALVPIAGQLFAGLPRATRPTAPATPAAVPDVRSRAARRFSHRTCAQVFRRDRFVCRYCGVRVMPLGVVSILAWVYPSELPYHRNYKAGMTHPVFWLNVAQADHVTAGSVGGDWHDIENHVTACAACNTIKRARDLSDLGWDLRAIEETPWDGLLPLYRPLWERARTVPEVQADVRAHSTWLRAFENTTS